MSVLEIERLPVGWGTQYFKAKEMKFDSLGRAWWVKEGYEGKSRARGNKRYLLEALDKLIELARR
jgi:hypothetical protein